MFDAFTPAPHADHARCRMNLSGTHRGNRYCLDHEVPVGVPDFDEDMASASVPVTSVVAGPANTLAVRDRMILRAFRTRAKTGMDLTRNFRATIKGFNASYGTNCKTWADVLDKADELLNN